MIFQPNLAFKLLRESHLERAQYANNGLGRCTSRPGSRLEEVMKTKTLLGPECELRIEMDRGATSQQLKLDRNRRVFLS